MHTMVFVYSTLFMAIFVVCKTYKTIWCIITMCYVVLEDMRSQKTGNIVIKQYVNTNKV